MKKIFTPNINAIILVILSIAETVIMILYKPLPIGAILGMQFIALLSIAEIRFANQLAYIRNAWYSLWNRKHSDFDEDDEPSTLAVGIIKGVGYFLLLLLQIAIIIF